MTVSMASVSFKTANGLLARHALAEHPADFPPCGVFRVQHPADTVGAFASERRVSCRIAIERGSPFDQLDDVMPPLLNEEFHSPLITQTVTRGDRVGRVQRW